MNLYLLVVDQGQIVRAYPVDQERLEIGRAESAHIRLDLPENFPKSRATDFKCRCF